MEDTRTFSQIVALVNHSANTKAVARIIIFIAANTFFIVQHEFYYYNILPASSSSNMERIMIRKGGIGFNSFRIPCTFVASIIADGYIRKVYMLEICAVLGELSAGFILIVAFLNCFHSYSTATHFKINMLKAYLGLKLFNTVNLSISTSILFDFIGKPREFLSYTSRIFTIAVIVDILSRSMVHFLAIFTHTDKLHSAAILFISPILHFIVLTYLFTLTIRKNWMIESVTRRHSFFKALGYLLWLIARCCKTKIFRVDKSKKPMVRRADVARKDHYAVFWRLVLFEVCLVPYFFIVSTVSVFNFSKYASGIELYLIYLYTDLLIFALTVIVQFIIFPAMNNAGFRYFNPPLRRISLSYVIVGIAGLLYFFLTISNQRNDPSVYSTIATRSVTIHNMFATSLRIEVDQSQEAVPIVIPPYRAHTMFFLMGDPLSAFFSNEHQEVQDFYYIHPTDRKRHFVVTQYGLEEIHLPFKYLRKMTSDNSRSRVIVICFMNICKNTIHVECRKQKETRELFRFGLNIEIILRVGDRCRAHISDEARGRAVYEFDVTDTSKHLAVVESKKGISIVSMDMTSPAQHHWISFIPLYVIICTANIILLVATYQFLLLETPEPLRTTIIGLLYVGKYVGSSTSKHYLIRNGLLRETTTYLVFGLFCVSYLLFLYVTQLFNSKQHLEDLKNTHLMKEKSLQIPRSSIGAVGRDSSSTHGSTHSNTDK